ncbi:MAG: DUF2974 domain-containing protein [Alteromonadaceae bacterium]|nr:DUF2974 domain-containing protein [Alteromonadaceae bacterium]
MWAAIGGAAVNGGNIVTGALMGAFTAGAAQYGMVASAFAGGIASRVQGGNFGHGFWSAGLGAGIGGGMGKGWAKVVTAAVVGGTISKLTGGKFKNGAISAAFMAVVTSSTAGEVQEASSDDVTKGKMSKAVYDVTTDDIGEYSIDGYKLKNVYTDNESGMKAALFVDAANQGVLAFAGTSPTSLSDWSANLIQAFGGTSSQHTAAFKLASTLYDASGGNLSFTGHSLGGGIAAAAAIRNGGSATVFNAAGVHSNTLGGASLSNGSVRYMYSSNDALRVLNRMTPSSVPGQHVSWVAWYGWDVSSDGMLIMNKLTIKYFGMCLLLLIGSSCSAEQSDLGSSEREYNKRMSQDLLANMSLETMFENTQIRKLAQAAGDGDGELSIVATLVQQGVDVNSRGKGNATPLFWSMKNFDGYNKLLELGADPNIIFNDGGNVIHWAMRIEDDRFLDAALKHGGDANLVAGMLENQPVFKIGGSTSKLEILLARLCCR